MYHETRQKRMHDDLVAVVILVILAAVVLVMGAIKAGCAGPLGQQATADTAYIVDTVRVPAQPTAFHPRPTEPTRVTSGFAAARHHPVLGYYRPHRGVDFAAPAGTPVEATAPGIVIHRGPLGGLGNAVVIRHPQGFMTRYGHLQDFSAVCVGDRVERGDLLGSVGSTGLATGPHVHYELLKQGTHMDPMKIAQQLDD